jgi:DNA-directed RNA polymerase subunit RPC12/RpoP
MSEVSYIVCARCGSNNMVSNSAPLDSINWHLPMLSLIDLPQGPALLFRCSHCWNEYPLVATPVFRREI